MRSPLTRRQLWGRAQLAFALCGLATAPGYSEEGDIYLPATSAVAANEIEPTEPAADSADTSAETTETTEAAKASLGRPTHKQVATISINGGDREETSLNCFCLSPKGTLLAACGAGPGEIREFTPTGEFVTSWSIAFKPEAINLGSDGNIYVAGQGKLLKLSDGGEVLLEADAPHVEAIAANPEKIREEIIEQHKQMREQFGTQIKTYEDMLKPLKDKPEEERTAEENQQIEMFEQVIKQYTEMTDQYNAEDLTEEELDKQVAANIEYKSRIASIDEYDGKVFIATGAIEGYGYNVWKMDHEFTGGEVIISDLSGCCGQMDVQCCENGIFVAENSRHRVGRYDTAGEMLTSWGKQAREGLQGFGSCCNPMNVAFGSDGSVYTAEDDTGRIKQFTPDGELVSLVGKVDVVPGCKKVAIAVAKDGGNVFMLDITNNAIMVMDRLKPGETVAYSESEAAGGSFIGSLKDALGL
jgi:hypothetical protein